MTTSTESVATESEDATTESREAADAATETTVTVRCTGLVRRELGEYEFDLTFAGDTLREFLAELFDRHPELDDLLLAESEDEATHRGWAPVPEELPGTWTKNPEGERTVAYARILVNGHFNENREGFDTGLSDGDRVALMYPFMFCC